MVLRVASINAFVGIDTTGAACPVVTASVSPTGPNQLMQGWTDTTEKTPTYSLFQLSGFNNSGKQLLVVFMAS